VLARRARRVLLVNASTPAFRIGEALPPAARPLLRDLGVSSSVLATTALPCFANASAWGGPDVHFTDFVFDVNGHGFHLDRARFDAALRSAAAAEGADVIDGVWMDARRSVRLGRHAWTVDHRWLIDATGRAAIAARRRGAHRIAEDSLVAFHAPFVPARGEALDRDGRTLVESGPEGWWYTALVPSAARVVAFLTDADLVDRAACLSPDGLIARISHTAHLQPLLRAHGYAMAARPRGASAASTRLDTFTGDHWMAAGDAALAFDPLSAQGIFNALYTGMLAGETVDAVLSGDRGAPARYSARLEDIHRAYRRNLAMFYAHETRWPEQTFWSRRRGPAPSAHREH
jgi:flavin-dependent dehydrogenase